MKQTVNWKARARPAFHPAGRFLSYNGSYETVAGGDNEIDRTTLCQAVARYKLS